MPIATTLDATELVVEPGQVQECEVLVRNDGDLVDQITVDVLGDAAGWATVLPETVNLMPGAEQAVQVAFAPPRSSEVPCGALPFAVRARSREDPYGSTIQEGTVEVAAFTDRGAELVPPRKRGRRAARFRLEVENAGNSPAVCRIEGFHPEEENVLDVELSHTGFVAAPGTVTTVRVRTVPVRRFLRGEPRPHPFTLELTGGPDEDATVIDGVMIQEPLLPKWLLPAVLIAVGLLVALVVLWYSLLVPRIRSIATEQVQPQVEAATEAAERADEAADDAVTVADALGVETGVDRTVAPEPGASADGAGEPGGADGGGPGDGGDAAAPDGAGAPIAFRIATDTEPVTDASFRTTSYTAPDGAPMELGDIVLQNPRGDTGLLQVRLGPDVVLEVGLANFRDLDYHYVTPLLVDADEPVVVAVACTAPGSGAPRCSPAVSFSGRLR